MSDRVIEAFAAAQEHGRDVIVAVLRSLADNVTKDLQLVEQIATSQTEIRSQAVVAVILPFGVLAFLVASNDSYRSFYQSDRRLDRGDRSESLMALGGWKLITVLGRVPAEHTRPRRTGGTAMIDGRVLSIALAVRDRRGLHSPAPSCGNRDRSPTRVQPTRRRASPPARHGSTGLDALGRPAAESGRDAGVRTVRAAARQRPGRRRRRIGLGLGRAAPPTGRARPDGRAVPDPPARLHRRRHSPPARSPASCSVGRAGIVLLLAVAGGLWGATRWRARLERLITKRRERMRAELYTVCQLLADLPPHR